ncbi:MAG: ATP synthase F1 subunit delta [Bacteroidia bacterium]
MVGTRIASRYAKSFIELAMEQGVLEEVYADMKLILETTKTSPDLVALLKSPIIDTNKKAVILKEIFETKINKLTLSYIQLIINKKREEHLVTIAQEFIIQYKEKKKILTAVITTAFGIDDITRKKVMEVVKGTGNNEVVLEEKIDKDIIGGFILRVGDKQIDASIARKLINLKNSFKENAFVKAS